MTSIVSRIKAILSGRPAPEDGPASRHDRREAGRERHHETGEPAWGPKDQVGSAPGESLDPDASPEILGGP